MRTKKDIQKRRRYDAEFKANILKLNAEGRTIRSLSESFGINENLIYRWKKLANKSIDTDQNEDLQENLALRAEIKQLKEERDILKKALAIFSRHP